MWVKYIDLHDTYKSVHEALYHGGIANKVKVEIIKIDAEELEKTEDLDSLFGDIHGILIPGGFGQRGITGMVKSAQYAPSERPALLRYLPGSAGNASSNTHATFWKSRMPTRRSSLRTARTPSSAFWKNRLTLPTTAEPCAWDAAKPS